jgi:hypothetical protein
LYFKKPNRSTTSSTPQKPAAKPAVVPSSSSTTKAKKPAEELIQWETSDNSNSNAFDGFTSFTGKIHTNVL